MAGPRQPIELVVAKGKKHLTKKEIAERERLEPKPQDDGPNIRAPAWLPEDLREEFNELRTRLVKALNFCKLDRDALGMYLVARRSFLAAAKLADTAIDKKDVDGAKDWGLVQDRYFKQARNCASDLGLSITSRCRLILPEGSRQPEETAFDRMLREREERQRRA